MDNMNKWYNHYIKNIDLEKIEWIKLNSTELYMFFKNNYLDKEVWKYVYDEKDNTIYPTPLGMYYLNFDNPINNKNYSFLLGIVENNIGKKTIVAATIYLDKCFMFTNQGKPVTCISSMEVNSYFRNKGIYKKMCEVLINYINLNQHMVTTEQTNMGARCNAFNILKNTLLSNGFHNCILEDNHGMINLELHDDVIHSRQNILSKKS